LILDPKSRGTEILIILAELRQIPICDYPKYHAISRDPVGPGSGEGLEPWQGVIRMSSGSAWKKSNRIKTIKSRGRIKRWSISQQADMNSKITIEPACPTYAQAECCLEDRAIRNLNIDKPKHSNIVTNRRKPPIGRISRRRTPVIVRVGDGPGPISYSTCNLQGGNKNKRGKQNVEHASYKEQIFLGY